ncbi:MULTISPECIES: uroporphyrinogen-III C-methyltransferase [unclassified Corynebacterium]|uniref:uroporphyrinogen-III C-methyltransferase n=1 Tax=unclassified Corynebacterium TaxID=2624378 RepID=UPI0029C9C490|nr:MULTISPECIES: uroporphyrinogen-III C-methyltransferase [unclassified Corynebacterium]WPF65308.1 uroporphyrinogen-III C-methyltransferase [Corynebacterium sp. 22KM0430]WPF67803.1 uroporphyrinogen-III C-methyltransferase [Corynebacterium sp. 21KM1197]
MTAAHQQSTPGHVYLVGGGPGAWDLITVRGMRALQSAEVILTDHLGPTAELDKLCDTSAKTIIDVSKLPYGKQTAQEKINDLLVEHAHAGAVVARLKGGDPYVFGRGFEEYEHCLRHGIDCEVIPGVTSAVAVPELAGIPLTQRGLVHSFHVVSGHLPPGHPRSRVDWSALARSGGTIVVIMGVRQAGAIAEALIDATLAPTTPCAIVQEGSTEREQVFRCTLGELEETMRNNQVQSPAVYVIGEVAGLGIDQPWG